MVMCVWGLGFVSNNSNSKVRRTFAKRFVQGLLFEVWRPDRVGRLLFAFVLFDGLCGGACRGKCGSLARAAC
jgi:hypothetical protein